MRIHDREWDFDYEIDEMSEIDERIWKEMTELERKGNLVFRTSAMDFCGHGEQWIELYEKAVMGRNDWEDGDKHEFKIGLAMIKDAWYDEKGNFFIEAHMGDCIILHNLEYPYRLQYLIYKHMGIQEGIMEPWIENNCGDTENIEIIEH